MRGFTLAKSKKVTSLTEQFKENSKKFQILFLLPSKFFKQGLKAMNAV